MSLRQKDGRSEDHKVAVVARLLEMSRGAGAPLVGVWWAGALPCVRYALWSEVVMLTWLEAEEMTGVYWDPAPPLKPMGRERLAVLIPAVSGF